MLYALFIAAAVAAPVGGVVSTSLVEGVTVDANGLMVPSGSLAPSDAFAGDAAKGSGEGGKKPKADEDDDSSDESDDSEESKDEGGCSAIGGAPAVLGAAFGLVAALRRRRQS